MNFLVKVQKNANYAPNFCLVCTFKCKFKKMQSNDPKIIHNSINSNQMISNFNLGVEHQKLKSTTKIK